VAAASAIPSPPKPASSSWAPRGRLGGAPNHTTLPERNLDVLRAVAVLCVLADHLLTTWGIQPRLFETWVSWDLGRMGVLLFFVHTSLVLMSSLEREGARRDWVRAFYMRRALRIYPLAIATILGVVMLGVPPHMTVRPILARAVAPTLKVLAANLTLTQNVAGQPDVLGVLWSLPLEVQMYVALPLCFLIAKRGVGSTLGALVGVGLMGAFVRFSGLPGLWRFSVALFGPCFMGGVLAYAILRTRKQAVLPSWTWCLLLLACVPLFVLLRPSDESPERGWLFCLGVGCAIPLARNLGESAFTRIAHLVCTYSYGIYLLHQPALWFSFSVLKGLPTAFQWLTCITLIVSLPGLFYHFVEHPGIQLGKRLVGKGARVVPQAPELCEGFAVPGIKYR